jgi:large subunit ribosomal protein L2
MFLLKTYKPTSPGVRHKVLTKNFEFLNSQKHFFFAKAMRNTGGRNSLGKITIWHKKSIVKNKKTLLVNKLRLNSVLISILVGIFKQKNNMCFLGLLKFSNGMFCYIYLAHGLKLTNYILPTSYLTKKFEFSLGSVYFFGQSYLSLPFFNICSSLTKKSIYAKAAGVFCKFVVKNFEKGYIKIILPSKQSKYLSFDYYCIIGRASNIYRYKHVFGKAGYVRKLGTKSTVRGVAMNPVDHPNGGRTKANQPEKTPWGKIAKKSK